MVSKEIAYDSVVLTNESYEVCRLMVINEKQRKLILPKTRYGLITDKIWIKYKAVTEIGLSTNIDR